MDTEGNGPRARQGFDTSRPTQSFAEVARGVLFEPARFFARLRESREEEGVGGPLLFAGACFAIGFFLTFLSAPLDPLAPEGVSDSSFDLFSPLFLLVVVPIATILGVFLIAVVQHLFVLVFVREQRGFRVTFLVVAYESAIGLVSWVPVLGYLIGLYGVYIATVGLREMHDTTTVRALLAVLVSYLLPYAWSVYNLFIAIPGS